MPANGDANFYFSWPMGPVFFISVDSEHDLAPGSPQHAWINATLAAVDRSVHPWIVATMHHPVLSSDSDEVPDHTPGGARGAALEPLFREWGVDVVVQGHQHNYERTAAVYNGTVVGLPDAANAYHAPGAPVYIVAGTSGAVLDYEKWIAPTPWSLVRDGDNYGYSRFEFATANGNRTLTASFVGVDGKIHDAWSIVKPVA